MHMHTLIYIFGEGNDFLNETDRHTSLKMINMIIRKTDHQMTP